MSKVLKVVAIVASIAAAVVTAGASLGISAALLSGIGVAASLGASLLAGKPKAPTAPPADRERLFASINPRAPRTMVFGRTAMATDIRDQEFTGTDKEYLHRFIVVASHKCQAIEQIWFDDKLAWNGAVQSEYAGYLTVTPILEGNAGNAINIGPRMGSTRRYTGCAYVHLRYKLTGNSKKSDSPFAQSVPTRMTIIGKGIACYDPRLDTTVGGLGSQRADDQSTWVWNDSASRNTKLQELTYLLGWRINGKLAVGKGVPPARIDIASYITAANACDESVSLAAGGTEPRYRTDGVVNEADDMGVVLDQFKSSSNSLIDDADGKIRTLVLSNDLGSPIASFGPDDILGNVQWKPFSDLTDRFNIVRGTFTDSSTNSLYQSVDYPEVSLASADGVERVYTVDFPMVQSASQAQRLAKQRLQRAQYAGTLNCQMQSTAWRVQKNDVITLTFPPLGFANKLFRMVATSVRIDGIVDVTLREENAAVYAWDMNESAPVSAAAPTTYLYTDNPLYQDLQTLPTYQDTPPGATGGIGHLYIDATGKKFRFVGTQLLFNGDPLLFNGEPIYTSGYVDAQDQLSVTAAANALEGIANAANAQNTADGAQAIAQAVASNFDARNDRIATPVIAPVIAGGGTAIDHVANPSGTVDVSFEWSWAGLEAEIDGFQILARNSATGGAYTIGSAPAEESVFTIPSGRRAHIFYGIDPTKYYTFAVRAFRVVDPDIDADELLVSSWEKSTASGENPYQPAANVAFVGDITGTINGIVPTRNIGRGSYSGGATYNLGDLVVWQVADGGDGFGYVRVGTGDTTGIDPTDGTKWQPFVESGSAGVDGDAAISGSLTNEAHTLPADSAGVVSSYSGATGTFNVYQGAVDVTSLFTLATQSNPQGLTIGYAAQVYTVTAGFDAGEDAAFVVIRATGSGALAGVTLDKLFSLGKSKTGTDGANGLSNAQVTIYKRSATTPSVPSTTSTYTFATAVLTGHDNGWTQAIPASDGNPLYATTAAASASGATDTIATGDWSAPIIVQQEAGATPKVTLSGNDSVPSSGSTETTIATDSLTIMAGGKFRVSGTIYNTLPGTDVSEFTLRLKVAGTTIFSGLCKISNTGVLTLNQTFGWPGQLPSNPAGAGSQTITVTRQRGGTVGSGLAEYDFNFLLEQVS